METAVCRSACLLARLGCPKCWAWTCAASLYLLTPRASRGGAKKKIKKKKASASICRFGHLMGADQRRRGADNTDKIIKNKIYIGSWRISHKGKPVHAPLGISKPRTFSRLKIHPATEASAILSLARPIHANGCTCASDPPGQGHCREGAEAFSGRSGTYRHISPPVRPVWPGTRGFLCPTWRVDTGTFRCVPLKREDYRLVGDSWW